MPLMRLPGFPLGDKALGERCFNDHHDRCRRKAKLNSSSEYPACPQERGAVGKNTKNVPMAALNLSV